MWQVSGAHGAIDPARAVEEMFTYHDAGFTSWDLADHYGPAEDLIGEFPGRHSPRVEEPSGWRRSRLSPNGCLIPAA